MNASKFLVSAASTLALTSMIGLAQAQPATAANPTGRATAPEVESKAAAGAAATTPRITPPTTTPMPATGTSAADMNRSAQTGTAAYPSNTPSTLPGSSSTMPDSSTTTTTTTTPSTSTTTTSPSGNARTTGERPARTDRN